MPKRFHLEPSWFSTLHARKEPTALSRLPKEGVFSSSSPSFAQPVTGLASMEAKLSTATEQSFTPNTPVASNRIADWPGARCTSNAITFLPATAPTIGRITWNLEKEES